MLRQSSVFDDCDFNASVVVRRAFYIVDELSQHTLTADRGGEVNRHNAESLASHRAAHEAVTKLGVYGFGKLGKRSRLACLRKGIVFSAKLVKKVFGVIIHTGYSGFGLAVFLMTILALITGVNAV